MSTLYYHAELNNYAVVGRANRSERDQGLFVKYGDGGVDVSAIGHLYKTQVYQLAAFLDVPLEIQRRSLASSTQSVDRTPEEFSFRLPFHTRDLLLYAQDQSVSAAEVAHVMGLSLDQVQRAFRQLARERRSTEYVRMMPIGLGDRTPKKLRVSLVPHRASGSR